MALVVKDKRGKSGQQNRRCLAKGDRARDLHNVKPVRATETSWVAPSETTKLLSFLF